MNLKDEILRCRAIQKLSQRKFAELCGVSYMTIYRIENGGNTSKRTETLIRMKIEELEGI